MRPVVLSIALTAPLTALSADVDSFNPGSSSVFGVGSLQAESPHLVGEGAAGALLTAFAQDPVIRTFANGDETPAVASMLPMTLYGGYTIAERARIDLLAPIYPHVNAPMQDFQGPALGDLRLQGVVPVYTMSESFAVAVVPKIALPTGTANALTRQGLQGGLAVAVGGELEGVRLGYVANAGITGAAADELGGIGLGSTVDAVLGSYVRATDSFRIGGELDLHGGLAKGTNSANTTASAHLFANNVLENGIGMTLGAGTGLLSGLGTPDYRIFVGFSYAQIERDRDQDGLADKDDACPREAEDMDGFEDADGCPDPDNDGDTVADVDDSCPGEPEDADGFEDADGCPDMDNDEDGIPDAEDGCPDEAGPELAEGCPDLDGDGVPDYRDACQSEVKPSDEPPQISDGCPKDAWVTSTGIRFDGKILFDNGRASISESSFALLDTLRGLLEDNPDVGRVEVQGHTDNTGRPEDNLELSQARADAVRQHLIDKGADEDRLLAKGYGDAQPISTNRTERGRELNRRVAFEFLDAPVLASTAPDASTPAPGADPDGEPGLLSVSIDGGGWANVYIDGTRLTKGAPFSDQPVAAGPHTVWIANERMGIDYTQDILVQNGQAVQIEVPAGASGETAVPDDPWGSQAADEKEEAVSPWGDLTEEIERPDSSSDEDEDAPRGRFSKRKNK